MEIDGFEIEDELGRGGFGVVYRARQLAFNRLVAVKVLHDTHQNQDLQKQFAKECRAVGALRSHRHILRVYSTGSTADGAPYLAMELLVRGSLADRLPLAVDAVRTLGIELAAALQVAHDGGVIHRDVKPGNILYNDDDEPVLVDFGISSLVGEPSTTSTEVALSLGYAPPEVLGDARPAVAADVYALGATLFAAASGRTPFVGEGGYTSIAVLAGRILTQPVEDLRPLGVPDDLCRVIEKAMAKDPADRYASMTELQAALARVRSDETVRLSDIAHRPTRPIAPGDSAPTRPRRRRRATLAIVAAVVLVLVAVGVAIGLHHSSTSGHPAAGAATSPTSSPTAKVSAAPRYDASNLNCRDSDDLIGVATYSKPADRLYFYPRTKRFNTGDPRLPTDYDTVGLGPMPTTHHFGTRFTSLLTPGDITGDGLPDLLGQDRHGVVYLMKGRCSGYFYPSHAILALDPQETLQFAPVGDFNGDGIPDLLGVDTNHSLFFYRGLGNGTFSSTGIAVQPETSTWTSVIAVGDVNGDGHPDVIDRHADGSLWLFESSGLLERSGRGGWLASTKASQGGIELALTLPPQQFPYVIGGVRFFDDQVPDLAAMDVYGQLLVYRATMSAGRPGYSRTCYDAGHGWLPPRGLSPVADAVSVPSVRIPERIFGHGSTSTTGKNADPLFVTCMG